MCLVDEHNDGWHEDMSWVGIRLRLHLVCTCIDNRACSNIITYYGRTAKNLFTILIFTTYPNNRFDIILSCCYPHSPTMEPVQLLKQRAHTTLSLSAGSYIYELAHDLNDDMLAVIASDNSLRILHPHTLALLFGSDSVFPRIHTRGGVTSLCAYSGRQESQGALFVTGGRDGVVRVWDARSANKSPITTFDSGM